MSSSKTSVVRVATASSSATLTKDQKTFNRWIKKIEAQRKLLLEWQNTVPLYRAEHASKLQPLIEKFIERRIELVKLLDRAHDIHKFGSAQRSKLQAFIGSLAEDLLESRDSPELIELYNKHSDIDYETLQREAAEETQAFAKEVFGMDLGDDADLSPQGVMDALEKKMREEQALEDEEPAFEPPPNLKRKASAKAMAQDAKLEREAQQASQSVREVYRQLASALHPDREPDAAERERKTELMQRVNVAYEAKDLLQLLELQLKIEQIDQDAISNLGGPRLKHYNKVLATQSEELQMEIDSIEMMFVDPDPFEFRPLGMRPVWIMHRLKGDIADLRATIAGIEHDLQILHDVEQVKALLRELPASLSSKRRKGDAPPAAPSPAGAGPRPACVQPKPGSGD